MAPSNPFGDLVVVIPGILGSRLIRKEGKRSTTVWDLSIKSLPRLLQQLASNGLVLDQQDGVPADGVEADELFSYQWLPGFFGVDDYAPLVAALRKTLGSDSGQLLTFPYDWRASNRHAAAKLADRALSALGQWKKDSGNTQAKLWLVCHSMGGLVARYFCEQLGGAPHTRAIVTLGTPHRGSVNALDALANGKTFWPLNLTRFLRSMPAVYELLPLFPAIGVGPGHEAALHHIADFFGLDPVTGQDEPGAESSVTLPVLQGLDRGMVKRALEFHAGIREPAEKRAAEGASTPYRQYVFFNRRQRTALSARLERQKLEVFNYYPATGERWIDDRGDGTVPSFASVPIEWETTAEAIPIGEKHAALQTAEVVASSLHNWLRPLDVRKLKGVADNSVVELNVPPVLAASEELVVDLASLEPTNVMVQLHDAEGRLKAERPASLRGEDQHDTVGFRRLPAGVYRVSAVPQDRMQIVVSDLVLVPEAA